MVVGFNHNFRYRGEVYHVQTEDSGRKNPHIITLLYHGGTILASKKTSYADIATTDHLERVVEDLMKTQHKEMLRRLKDGEFDAIIDGSRPAADVSAAGEPAEVAAPLPEAPDGVPEQAASPQPPVAARPAQVSAPLPPVPPDKDKPEAKRPDLSFDEMILSYLVGDDK
jgi:hypothetical protein